MAVGLAFILAGSATLASAAEDFAWKEKLAPGGALEIRNISGDIRIEDGKGPEVEVVARKHGDKSNPAEVKIEVVKHPQGVTICAVYPSGSTPNQCLPGGGHMNIPDGNDVTVAFTIKAPPGLRFIGRTVNGGIKSTATNGEADVKTVNGSIEISASGSVRAETVNGSVRARMDRTDWKGEITIATVNGSVTIDLPASASVDVHAKTVNGNIDTDFGLPVEGKWGPRRLSGTIGSGGRVLTASTVNGSIKLRRHA
jgi:hypothetical protein